MYGRHTDYHACKGCYAVQQDLLKMQHGSLQKYMRITCRVREVAEVHWGFAGQRLREFGTDACSIAKCSSNKCDKRNTRDGVDKQTEARLECLV